VAFVIAYTGKTSPPYRKVFSDRNTGLPLNLTGLATANFTAYVINSETGAETLLAGTWSIVNAAQGIAQYQWKLDDLAQPKMITFWVSIQMPGEVGSREFDPDTIVVLPTPEYLAGVLMTVQQVNVTDANGNQLTASTAIPVEIATTLSTVILNTLLMISGNPISTTNPVPENIAQVGGSTLALGQNTMANSLPVTLASNQATNGNPLGIQDIEQAGYIALVSPPVNTSTGSDTALTFSSQVNRIILQNNYSATIYFDFDQVSSTSSFALLPGMLLSYPKKCTVSHIYTSVAVPLNAANGLIVRGAL